MERKKMQSTMKKKFTLTMTKHRGRCAGNTSSEKLPKSGTRTRAEEANCV